MTRGILIAGNESSLFSAAAVEAVKRVESFASIHIPNRFPLPEGKGVIAPAAETPGAIPLSWNPASPIAARTVVLAAENRLTQINDAILICSPPTVFKTAEILTPEEIEILVNDHIKGWFYLIRELVLYFRRRGEGSLSLAVPEVISGRDTAGTNILDTIRGINPWGAHGGNKNTPTDFVGPSASASFRAFAQGILASQASEPFQVMGFTTAEAGNEGDFAAWFFKIIDEGSGKNSGRWHKYTKPKFFR
ncbi:MAG: hypothetical protein FWB99_03440 [Treponema sp.]|nr:hypothetical protein [Treponema sp.]